MDDQPPPMELRFDRGTVLVQGGDAAVRAKLPHVKFDPRVGAERIEAIHYRSLVEWLRANKIAYTDHARDYQPVVWTDQSKRKAFPHQSNAVEAWWKANAKGLVVLPTGTGKTYTAVLAIVKAGRPALVVTPTIDLLHQWHAELQNAFGTTVGMMGGGEHDIQPLTVSTYDSASIHVERWGAKFGLLVFDECHHLPGPTYALAARMSLAPFRMGLTATPERADGGESLYEGLIGPIVFRKEIGELSGRFLADYRTVQVFVQMTSEEFQQFEKHRANYRGFVANLGISIGSPDGWRRFLFEAARTPAGRQAMQSYREMKKIERQASGKFKMLEELLVKHRKDRLLIFTADNATVYDISRRYFIPALTHQTKAKERKAMLVRFHKGEYSAIVTSQVLNEGVDVPAASVGIVLSGTSTVRENVQRLGRILRKQPDKQATLYELILEGTSEVYSSERRRQHHAFE